MMRNVLRWAGRGAAGLALLAVAALGSVYALSAWRLRTTFPVPDHLATVAADSASLARGQHLVRTRGCDDCHGADLGGKVMVDDPAIGRIVTANLTSGGRGAELSAADWERAVRHGVRRDGSVLMIMPSQEFQFTDEDMSAMVAYLRTVPRVERALPALRLGPVGRLLYLAGEIDAAPAEHIDHARPHAKTMATALTPEFGMYVARACQGCHGPTYSGGKVPGMPPDFPAARNITPDRATGIGAWSEEEFVHLLNTGMRPDGTKVDTVAMPIMTVSRMSETEKRALYRYLRTVPAKPAGGR